MKIFEDCNQCEDYIRSISSDDRLILIIDDLFARQIVPRIEQLRQVILNDSDIGGPQCIPEKPRSSTRKCSLCDKFLCRKFCFQAFHRIDVDGEDRIIGFRERNKANLDLVEERLVAMN